MPRARSTALRMALANIHRPGALTPTIVLSLGLGLALLVTLIEIDGNLRRQFTAALPAKAPSFFFLDIRPNEAERFDTFVQKLAAGAKLEAVPMLRGRIVSANGIAAEDIKAKPEAAWVLQGDRGITYTETCRTARHRRRQMVGQELRRAAGGFVREARRRRARPQGRRRSPSTCSAATSPRRSPICAGSIGKASASISSWCFRRARFTARRTRVWQR